MKKISWIVVVCSFIAACKKEKVQMNEENFFLIGESKLFNVEYVTPPPFKTIEIPFNLKINNNFIIEIFDENNNLYAKGQISKLNIVKKEKKFEVDLLYDLNNRYNLNETKFEYDIKIKYIKSKDKSGKEFLQTINKLYFEIIPIRKYDAISNRIYIVNYEYVLSFRSFVDIYQNKFKIYKYEVYYI
jgi:hypothetical protein